MKRLLLCLLLAASPGAFIGCEEQGPVEEAGEKIDEGVEDAKESVEDAAD